MVVMTLKNRLTVISKKQLSNIWTLFIRYVISKQISRYKTDGISFNNMPEVLHAMAENGLLTEKELSRKHIDASWGIKAHDIVVNSYDSNRGRKKIL
ncbi:hypothetical protein LN650_32000 [Klebsiella pneumoniae subsp. pneumoniae]|nr:hypothetical protein [Klebsiella pneumoniae subsp. pneumoniae]